jgi:[acyl-carrier-protein] S-malonyltransferase
MARAGSAHPGSMAAILKLQDEQVADICRQAAERSGDAVQVANYNSPGQVVISGGPSGVAAAVELVKSAGGRAMPLAVSVAAHSVLMAPAAAEFAGHVSDTSFSDPQVTIIGNVHALPLTTGDEIRVELVAQLTSPVQWTASVARMAATGASTLIELGPGNVLTGLTKRINPELATLNVAEPAHIAALA